MVGSRGLGAAALVDRDVDEDRALLHRAEHLAGDELRRARARDEDGADREVGVLDRLLELERGGHEELHAPAQDLLEVAHALDRALEDRHLRSHPERDHRGVVAHHPAADDEHARRRDSCDPAEQDPAAALRLLELVRARLRGEPAGDLAHRREQRKRAAVGLDGLVGDRGDTRVDERARERLVGGDVEVREERQALAQPRVLVRDRLLDLEQEVGRAQISSTEPSVAPARSYASSPKALPTPAPVSTRTS